MYTYMHVHMSVFKNVCAYVCLHAYLYVYVYTYIPNYNLCHPYNVTCMSVFWADSLVFVRSEENPQASQKDRPND